MYDVFGVVLALFDVLLGVSAACRLTVLCEAGPDDDFVDFRGILCSLYRPMFTGQRRVLHIKDRRRRRARATMLTQTTNWKARPREK